MGWGLINNKEALGVRVLRDKYNSGSDLIPKVKRTNWVSNLWKGFYKTWNHIVNGTHWSVANGASARF